MKMISGNNRGNQEAETGNAVIETLLIAPLTLAFVLLVAWVTWMGWLRLELSQLTQSLATCLQSTTPRNQCLRSYQTEIRLLPGKWTLERVWEKPKEIEVLLVPAEKEARSHLSGSLTATLVSRFCRPLRFREPRIQISKKPTLFSKLSAREYLQTGQH